MTEEEETKAMSRLLTRGAKMLQKGCDDCGNPLFRYRGEVVCPVCNERRRAEAKSESEESTLEEGTDATGETEFTENDKERGRERAADEGVDEHLRVLAKRLARDAAENSDDPEAVGRRLDALERTLEILRR